ncbi:MAG: hypothetical protein LZF63_02930 [Nitrosomonas sp.]|uniref:hypothetical protein n=1 Tax=Nitrosomonas sp. TaxID=42353 RepID=UPI0025E749C6|nr:hypothetical protein [Nitrosomonas sp.]MCG7755599.1 hypothetical protein [Nitrosomonas sp.]UJP03144.1 MAG: hypothetical protein LZF85_01395 [Nitrosomonas sp.]
MIAKVARYILFSFWTIALATFAYAADFSGKAAVDTRFFTEPPIFAQQKDGVAYPSVMIQPEFRHDWGSGNNRLTVIPFARYDSLDKHRTHWDVREFSWLHMQKNWDLLVGVGKVFWGTTESRQLVDIINQSDLIEKFSGEEKLGQPMVNFNLPTDYGHFSLFYLPYFRERTFPSSNGRFLFDPPVRNSEGKLDGVSHWQPSFAGRWSKTFGDWDIGVAHFWGVGREPRLVPSFGQGFTHPPTGLIPVYDLIHQTSIDVQGVLGNWIWKAEAITRSGQGDRFAAAVVGFEYTKYGVFGGSKDVGFLLEYLYDGRSSFAPPTPFNNDIFSGIRVVFNDPQNTEFLFTNTVDLNTQATILGFNASRRLGEKWKIELESRFFANISATKNPFAPPKEILTGMRNDDYIQLRVVRHF